MSKRKPLGVKVRFEVFKRDGFTCVYCGGQPPKVLLHCDHVVSVKSGGTNDIDNLVTSCQDCNLGKGARSLSSVPATVQQKKEMLEEREAQIIGFNQLIVEKRQRIEDTAWLVADVFLAQWGGTKFRSDWFASIERFVEDLSLDDLLFAANRAITKQPRNENACFSYFCGVCWGIIRNGGRL